MHRFLLILVALLITTSQLSAADAATVARQDSSATQDRIAAVRDPVIFPFVSTDQFPAASQTTDDTTFNCGCRSYCAANGAFCDTKGSGCWYPYDPWACESCSC
jgi:hypothetical protein